ncbi:MAG: hypothetical protein M1825_003667 [Sarcosagium campestre]|nr:MAG: hypothetical protein M1825_003667 [Sarcosagium campestre]
MDEIDLSTEGVNELLDVAGQRLAAALLKQPMSSAVPERLETGIIKPPNSYSLDSGELPKLYLALDKKIVKVDPSLLLSLPNRRHERQLRANDSLRPSQSIISDESKEGKSDHDRSSLSSADMDSELRRDLQLLHMRSVLDPRRHYKKEKRSKPLPPKHYQLGTIIQGSTEFFSARLSNKERKKTFMDEILSKDACIDEFMRKYGDVQTRRTSGKKRFYKELRAKRVRKARNM